MLKYFIYSILLIFVLLINSCYDIDYNVVKTIESEKVQKMDFSITATEVDTIVTEPQKNTEEEPFIDFYSGGDRDLKIQLSYKIKHKKLFIKGVTTIPNGTKIAIDLYRSDVLIAQADAKVHNGIFVAGGFSDRGSLLKGKFEVKTYSYFSAVWQSSSVLPKLLELKSNLIRREKSKYGDEIMFEITKSISISSTTTSIGEVNSCTITQDNIAEILDEIEDKINQLSRFNLMAPGPSYDQKIAEWNRNSKVWKEKLDSKNFGECCGLAKRYTKIASNEITQLGREYAQLSQSAKSNVKLMTKNVDISINTARESLKRCD